jgi:DNA-binding response OmpR family regulator
MPTIVWIDPDTDLIGAVVLPLEQAGYDIVRFGTVQAALDAVEQIRHADLLLLAMQIPSTLEPYAGSRFSGLELLRELLLRRKVTTPIIVFTAARDMSLYHELKALGVSDIVRKPALPSALKATVEAVLSKRRGRKWQQRRSLGSKTTLTLSILW